MTIHSQQTEAIAKALKEGKIQPFEEGLGFCDSLIDKDRYNCELIEEWFENSVIILLYNEGHYVSKAIILSAEHTLGRMQEIHVKMGDSLDDIHSEEPYWPFK